MKLLEKIDKIPGGIILVPMLSTALINTFCPGLLQIGGITTKVFSTYATQAFIGVLLFLAGSQFEVRNFRSAMKRGGVLFLAKLIIAIAATTIFVKLFGTEGVLGISALAFCIVMVSLNPGTCLAVSAMYGDQDDLPGFGLYNLIVAPSVPAVILGMLDGAAFDYMSVVTTLIPFLLGMLLGNLDGEIRKLFGAATRPMLFFAGCDFGAAVNLFSAVKTGVSGIVLSAVYIIICLFGLFLVDKLILRQPGYASVSLSCVAGASVSMPVIVAESLPQYASCAETATAQVACAVVITTVFSCLFTRVVLKKWGGAGR